jgi:hypothetical protein
LVRKALRTQEVPLSNTRIEILVAVIVASGPRAGAVLAANRRTDFWDGEGHFSHVRMRAETDARPRIGSRTARSRSWRCWRYAIGPQNIFIAGPKIEIAALAIVR